MKGARGSTQEKTGARQRLVATRRRRTSRRICSTSSSSSTSSCASRFGAPIRRLWHNKKDLTPVPESTQILLDMHPAQGEARHLGEFKKVLAGDQATQAVLAEYREKLQNWLRLILRKERRIDNPNPQMTYKMWVALMDGPDPETRERGRQAAMPQDGRRVVPLRVPDHRRRTHVEEESDHFQGQAFDPTVPRPRAHRRLSRSRAVTSTLQSDVATPILPSSASALRCAVNMYEHLMTTFLPSHNRKAMTMATTRRGFRTCFLRRRLRCACGGDRHQGRPLRLAEADQDAPRLLASAAQAVVSVGERCSWTSTISLWEKAARHTADDFADARLLALHKGHLCTTRRPTRRDV